MVTLRVVWDANVRHLPHICFYAERDIHQVLLLLLFIDYLFISLFFVLSYFHNEKGEELTIDYGSQWWDVKLKNFSCQCGSKSCKYTGIVREQILQNGLVEETKQLEEPAVSET